MAWREPEIVLLELDGGAVAEHWLDMAEKLARVSVPQLAAKTCATLLRQQMGTRSCNNTVGARTARRVAVEAKRGRSTQLAKAKANTTCGVQHPAGGLKN